MGFLNSIRQRSASTLRRNKARNLKGRANAGSYGWWEHPQRGLQRSSPPKVGIALLPPCRRGRGMILSWSPQPQALSLGEIVRTKEVTPRNDV
jgi:hypothetical protein